MKKLTPNKVNETTGPVCRTDVAPSGPAPSPVFTPHPPPSPEEGFISKSELARRLHISLRTVDYWRRRGIIPCIKCGHSPMFDWPDVLAHLEKNFRICRQQSRRQPVRIPVIGYAGDPAPKEEK